ncbi:MAG: homoserine O-acetyltransferase [Armatimonadetes bacterium]|nr:homoserine O-acetyltransferase [Armatimonadota bacterium]
MSDPLNVLSDKRQTGHDPPDDPRSVGWTRPQRVVLADERNPLPLDGGGTLQPVTVEFETYGELSPARDNAVLIFHALSGDAHAAGWCAAAGEGNRPWRKARPGWWDTAIGPGKAFDTSRYQVICANVMGSCYGTTGPSSINPATGQPYALSFPVVTVGDWVRLQVRLLDHLGIERLLGAAGGSLGGQQVIELGLAYPERVKGLIVLAASPRLSAQGLAFNTVARHAIATDPHFHGGNYYGQSEQPDRGLGIARMIGHITYLSETSMQAKFGRRLQDRERLGYTFDVDFQVESYLGHQAQAFGERFDANSYLYITKAMDYYDAANWGEGDLRAACRRAQGSWLVTSFTSDWLYPPWACRELVDALCANHRRVTYIDIESSYGHDAFLLEVETTEQLMRDFLAGVAGSGR